MDQLLLFLVSLIANLFSAFSGGGAGLLQLPVLIFLGLPFGVALATHKVASVALGVGGVGATVRHMREDTLERDFTLFVLATGLPGVVLGASLILHVPGRWAEIALGCLTLGLGLYSGSRNRLGQRYQPSHRDRRGMLQGGAGLFFLGFLNGSLTSGTGLFVSGWCAGSVSTTSGPWPTPWCWWGCSGTAPARLPWESWAISSGHGCRHCLQGRCWVVTVARTWR